MSWEREPLFTKAKLFFEKAYGEDKESLFFGLWCAMGLELLARSAVSHVSPTLLAEPDRNQHNLLHALNLGTSSKRQSITTNQVLILCQNLIKDFTETHFKIASAIVNRRNEELHSGMAAFSDYPTQQWIGGFYKCCKLLAEYQDESLNSLFGEEVVEEALAILEAIKEEAFDKTQQQIAAHRRVFNSKSAEKQESLKEEAQKNSDNLAFKGHHKVECPACGCVGTVTGEPYGKELVENKMSEIIVRRSILPTNFSCTACELQLSGYNILTAANIANHYTRRLSYTPEEFYDMINPEDYDTIAEKFYEQNGSPFEEYDNE